MKKFLTIITLPLFICIGEANAKPYLELLEGSFSGNVEDTIALGDLYSNGGEYSRARQEYVRAADYGSTVAMKRVGMMHVKGRGGKKDPKAAISWYVEALKSPGKAELASRAKVAKFEGRTIPPL